MTEDDAIMTDDVDDRDCATHQDHHHHHQHHRASSVAFRIIMT